MSEVKAIKTYRMTMNELKKYNPIIGRQVEIQTSSDLGTAMLMAQKNFKGYEIVEAGTVEDEVYTKIYPAPPPEADIDAEVDKIVDELLGAQEDELPVPHAQVAVNISVAGEYNA
jgi:hypothetical protein